MNDIAQVELIGGEAYVSVRGLMAHFDSAADTVEAFCGNGASAVAVSATLRQTVETLAGMRARHE